MNRIIVLLSVSLFLAACGGGDPEPTESAAPAPPAPLPGAGIVAFSGAAIWDGTGSALKYNENLLVRDGRIEGYSAEIPEGAEVIDLGGNWIVPGFINSHGHVSGSWAADGVTDPTERVKGDLTLYARYGVTSVVSLGGEPPEAFALRAMNDDPSLTHARLHVAGEVVAGNTPDEALAIARANIERGADWIKLRVDDSLGSGQKMPWDAVQAVIGAAKAADIPVATHIFYLDDAAQLLQMGTGLIAHSVRDKAATDEFVQAMLDTGVCYVPTLTREVSTFTYAERPAWFDDPFFLEAAKRSEIDRVSQPDYMARVAASPASAAYRTALVQAQDNLRIVLGSGVPGRMRVGIVWECTKLRWSLVEPDALTDTVIQFSETPAAGPVSALFKRRKEGFLYRKQQLGDHVPIDATQALKTEHAAGTSSECLVIEDLLIEQS